MDGKQKINIIKKTVECCFVKGSCYSCHFYQEPYNGHPGKCMGMKDAGKLLIEYLNDIEKELQNGKEKG